MYAEVQLAPVDLYQIDLADAEALAVHYWNELDPTEQQRADTFATSTLRARFIVAHGALRRIIARTIGADPAAVRLGIGDHGKPRLSDHPLAFNLTHAGRWAMVATSLRAEVGIDIERLRAIDAAGLAAKYLSAAEQDQWGASPSDAQEPTLLRLWVRKEAFIKATGHGLHRPLDSFDVSVAGPAGLVATRPEADEIHRWYLWDIPAPPDHVASLAVSRPPGQLWLAPTEVTLFDHLR